MKNFDLVNYLKNNPLINEIKAVPSADYLEIKLTPENEYGEARDIEKIIIPKYSYRLNQNDINYLQSEEVIIPEEEGFFPYLHAVLEEYVEKSKRENLFKLSVRNKLVQDLVNDLHLYIKANNVRSLGDTSPRDEVYYIFQEYLNKIFPNLSEDWNNYFERRNGIDALEANDYEYFIRTLFGGVNENSRINEIKVKGVSKFDQVKELVIQNVKSLSEIYEDTVFDLTEFNKTVNKIYNLDELENYVTNYLYSEKILEKQYEVGEFWMGIYKEVAGLNENNDINEIKVMGVSKYDKLKDIILDNFEDLYLTLEINPEQINKIKNNLNLATSLNDIEEIFYLEKDRIGYNSQEVMDSWIDTLKFFIEQI